MSILRCLFVLFSLLLFSSQTRADNYDDLLALRNGVKEIAAPGAPGPLCVCGSQAFPVVVGKEGKGISAPVVAAAPVGKGRLVAFGHTDYFSSETLQKADTGRLVLNAAGWARGKSGEKVGVKGLPALVDYLKGQGIAAESLDGGWTQNTASYSVICCSSQSLRENEIAALRGYLREGGGLLVTGLGWGWLQLNPGKTIQEHPGNRLCADTGILWADGSVEKTTPTGYAVTGTPSPLTQATEALNAVRSHSEGKEVYKKSELNQAVWTLSLAARTLAENDAILRPALRSLQKKYQTSLANIGQKPITSDQPMERLLLTLELEESRALPVEKVTAHPAAAAFPGSVPINAPRISRAVSINLSLSDWHSTGVYAAPGEKIEAEIPAEMIRRGYSIRIGAHTDTLWHLNTLERAPEISRAFPLNSAHVTAANSFGGLIYVTGPHNPSPSNKTVVVTIHNAVEAPYFERGKTDMKEWKERIRQSAAPWAELATKKIILTMPSEFIRSLDDPESLLKLWDDAMDNIADLASISRERLRPERMVADKQISAGYMHSGYPIMTGLDVASVMVDKDRILHNGHGGVWGFWHEVGHNHQRPDWTFEGTGEVTNNLFALYVFENVCGINEAQHPALKSDKIRERLQKYITDGAKFEKWKNDPFLALTMYIQIRKEFGWEPFKKAFGEYLALPESQRPKTEIEKHNQWMVRLSRAAGRNLGPFFMLWGVPTTADARQSISDLPVWSSRDFLEFKNR